MKIKLTFLFAIIMLVGGIFHFVKPEIYDALIPNYLPKLAINYISGIVEIALGIGLFIPQTRKISAIGLFLLMIAFLPLHLIDIFAPHPAMGTMQIAIVRFVLHFGLIYWAWYICKK